MAGFGCFVFACIVAVCCLFLFLRMEKNEFYKFYTYLDDVGDLRKGTDVEKSNPDGGGKQQHQAVTRAVLRSILSRCWMFSVALLLVGVTTAMVYPSAASLVRPIDYDEDSDWDEIFFTQVMMAINFTRELTLP